MSKSGEVAAVDTSESPPPSDDPKLDELSPKPVAVVAPRGLSKDRRVTSTELAGDGSGGLIGPVMEELEGLLRNKEGRETGGFERFGGESALTAFESGGEGEGEAELESVDASTLVLLVELVLSLLPPSPLLDAVDIETEPTPLSSAAPLLALLDLLLLSNPVRVTDNRFLDLLLDR